jgi:hypothetical protein
MFFLYLKAYKNIRKKNKIPSITRHQKSGEKQSDTHICTYIPRILSAGWGFPVWAAAALMRAIRLRLTE